MYLNSKLVRSLIADIISAGEKSDLFYRSEIDRVKLTVDFDVEGFSKSCFGIDFKGLNLYDMNAKFISICKNYIFPKYNGIFNIFDYRCGEEDLFLFEFGEKVELCSGTDLSKYFVARQNFSGVLSELYHGDVCTIHDEGNSCLVLNHYYSDDILYYEYASGIAKYVSERDDRTIAEKNEVTSYLKAYLKAVTDLGVPIHEGFLYNPIPKYIDSTPYFALDSGECVLWSELSGFASIYGSDSGVAYIKDVFGIPVYMTGVHDVRRMLS